MSQLITRGIGPGVGLLITEGLGVLTLIEGTLYAGGVALGVVPPGGTVALVDAPDGLVASSLDVPSGLALKVVYVDGVPIAIILPSGKGHVLEEE